MNIQETVKKISYTHKKKIILCILITLISGILFNIVNIPVFNISGTSANDTARIVPTISTITIDLKDMDKQIPVMGNITYRDKATISSKIFGRIERLYVEQGDHVRGGTPLAKIETHSLELQKKEALAEKDAAEASLRLAGEKLEQAKRSIKQHLKSIAKSKIALQDNYVSFKNSEDVLRKKEQLFKVGGISETELNSQRTAHNNTRSKFLTAKKDYEMLLVGYTNNDIKRAGYTIPDTPGKRVRMLTRLNTGMERSEVQAAESNLRKIETSIQILERNIQEATIRSPISGIVAVRNIEVGEKVKEDTDLFVVMNIDQLYMVVNINEKESTRLQKGQPVSFTVDALPGTTFSGKVHLVSPILDTSTRTVEVKIQCPNPAMKLKPGMFARAKVYTRTFTDAIAIPVHCIKNPDSDTPTIFVCRQDMVFTRKVVTGEPIDEERVLVTEGLTEGERIASSHLELLKDRMKVTYPHHETEKEDEK